MSNRLRVHKTKQFLKGEEGALAVWFALTFALFIGAVAVAIDFMRFYETRGKLQSIAVSAVQLVSANSSYTDGETLNKMAEDFVNSQVQFHITSDIELSAFLLEEISDTSKHGHKITLQASLPYTYISVVGINRQFQFNVEVKSEFKPTEADVVLVLDNSNALLSQPLQDTVNFLQSQFNKQSGFGNQLRLGVVPMASEFVNISPNSNWTDNPASRIGCVKRRKDVAGTDFTLPADNLFPALSNANVIGIQSTEAETSIRKGLKCPALRLLPLTSDWGHIVREFSVPQLYPKFILERGLLWAGRMLAPEWEGVWRGQSSVKGSPNKHILLLLGTEIGNVRQSARDFVHVCELLASNRMKLWVLDLSNDGENLNAFQKCSALAGYKSVLNQEEFRSAIADFSQIFANYSISHLE
ncbi:TadE/TadG family type IV pilus assembly protein [Sneathiella glossodoripedis]|uniref:TadE/TadG family type IV pilus assembly protein n=1 Tax=Sneathiella glossodoripedis TaxID=418853 RepID=UPI000472564A|nr:hypothetical protein [Sneathiella glossodoripedis]